MPETWLLTCPVPRYEILVLSCPSSPCVCRHSVCLWPVSFGDPVLTGAAFSRVWKLILKFKCQLQSYLCGSFWKQRWAQQFISPVPSPYRSSFARVSCWLLPTLPSRLLEHDLFPFIRCLSHPIMCHLGFLKNMPLSFLEYSPPSQMQWIPPSIPLELAP